MRRIQWSYGVTTVPSRMCDLLPQTLKSLELAGFPNPRLFVDNCTLNQAEAYVVEYPACPLTTHVPPHLSIVGSWILAVWELYLRDPEATHYGIFQDDLVAYRNLRTYLERCEFPEKGYWNLYTFPHNHKLAPAGKTGWHYSDQMGKGAVAIVLSRVGVQTLLSHQHLIQKPAVAGKRSHRAIDGGIITAYKKAGWREYVHAPSLVQHTGTRSSMGNGKHPLADSFRGEEFDALELLKEERICL